MESNNRIRKEVSKSPLTVGKIYKSDYQKEGTLTAELRQAVTTKSFYPSKSVANSLQDNVFATTDFGFKDKEYETTENRVAWIDVPLGSTVESVTAKLAAFPNANLYRILSNKPILSDTEQYAIEAPELDVTLDVFAERQVVRYPDTAEENAGELATDTNGKIQYRRIAFSSKETVDQDIRTAEPSDFYATPELEAELNGGVNVMQNQSLK